MKSSPFKSFWMAGYECADQVNKHGVRVDLLTSTNHLQQIDTDYALLESFRIKTVREGIRWSAVEVRPYEYNWSDVSFMIDQAKKMGIQQLWDICHFGFPDDLTPLHPMFSKRFEALCKDFVRLFRSIDPYAPILVTPINEVSFLSWLGGDAAGTSPFCVRQGWEVKYHLMRAYIQGVAAMKAMDHNVVVISTEPLVHIITADETCPLQATSAAKQREEQFQALDMLCGYICPELGGRPEYLDIVGVNFYYSNQWVHGTNQPLAWAAHDRHESWRPLHELVEEVYLRYGKPIVITETSHPGDDRGLWIEYIGEECRQIVEKFIPLFGVCIYPIIDRPDWDYLELWHHSGLWDTDFDNPDPRQRILCQSFATALRQTQHMLSRSMAINVEPVT